MGAIHFEHVTKHYRLGSIATHGMKNVLLHLPTYIREALRHEPFCALTDVSFDVAPGECLGLIGPNGSGKSTTLGLIARVLKPTKGVIRTQERICPLLELGAGFHYELTGRENILLNGVLLGMTREEVRLRTDDIIDFSGLDDFIDRPVRVYSSGMVARLGFSVAVHLEPDILLVDEVLAVGDESFQTRCFRKMESFRDGGTTLVFVSHNMDAIRKICSRAAYLEHGRLAAVGGVEEVVAAYEARVTAGGKTP